MEKRESKRCKMKYSRIFSFTLLGLAVAAIILIAIQPRYKPQPVKFFRGGVDRSLTPPPKDIQTVDGENLISNYHQPYSAEKTPVLCEIEELDPTLAKPPEHLKEIALSQNTKTYLYHDMATSAGPNGPVDGMFAFMRKKDGEIFLQTDTQAFTIKNKTRHGVDVVFEYGDLVCNASGWARSSQSIGPLATFAHQASDIEFETLFVRGRVKAGCLTLLDERGDHHLAVFPDRQDDDLIHTLVHDGTSKYLPKADLVWLEPLPVPVAGRKIDLSEPVSECGGVSKVMLLRDNPIWVEEWHEYWYQFPLP